MKGIKLMVKMFFNEPLWFKVLISVTFLASVILSSSFFSDHGYLRGYSKLAAAIFFLAYAFKIRMSYGKAGILLACSLICIYLFVTSIIH